MYVKPLFAESSPHGGAFWNIADFLLIILVLAVALLIFKLAAGSSITIIKKPTKKRKQRK